MKNQRTWWFSLACLLIVAMVLAACGGGAEPAAEEPAAPAQEETAAEEPASEEPAAEEPAAEEPAASGEKVTMAPKIAMRSSSNPSRRIPTMIQLPPPRWLTACLASLTSTVPPFPTSPGRVTSSRCPSPKLNWMKWAFWITTSAVTMAKFTPWVSLTWLC